MPHRTEDTTEFQTLPFSEKLILWAVRFWVDALKREVNAQSVLRNALRLAGARDAHPPLDDLLTILATSANNGIDVRCPKCPSVSPDERRLIGAIAAWQHDLDPAFADSFMSPWLPPSALRVARTPAAQLARTLKEAGLRLRMQDRALRQPEQGRPEIADEGQPITLH